MPTSLASILTQVKAVVDAVVSTAPDSRVHIGDRFFNSPEHMVVVGQDPSSTVPRLHMWVVARGGTTEEPLTVGSHLRQHKVNVDGWYQVSDETDDPLDVSIGYVMPSEATFNALVEHVCDHLRNDVQLRGGVAIDCSAPQLVALDIQQLADRNCHHATITLTISEEKLIALV